jgi:hypothetical protein
MACIDLGIWGYDILSYSAACSAEPTVQIWGDSITLNESLYTNTGCIPSDLLSTDGYYSNGTIWFRYDGLAEIIVEIGSCSSPTNEYCIFNTGTYDGNYVYAGTYNSNSYYSGTSLTGFIFYSITETRWCLAQNLGDPCVQFGPYNSASTEPDLDDTVMYEGTCVTTTTTTDPCATFDFDALFDCLVPESPTPTPSNTPTPTPTPSPSPSNPCGGRGMTVTSSGYTPTPTPTMTPTPTPSPQVTRPCNFSGEVIFNAFSEYMQCANSKKFKDCFTGIDYYTSGVVLVSGTTAPKENYVYNAVINGQGYCVIYEGLYENISGVDNITLTSEVGSYLNGACLDCLPNLTQTPTPTPTSTPTPTPSPSPCVSYEYRITNQSPVPVKFDYIGCGGSESQNVPAYSASIICASVTPTTTSPNIQIESLGSICI